MSFKKKLSEKFHEQTEGRMTLLEVARKAVY